MFNWASSTFDKLSQTVAPPPADGTGRFLYAVQRGDEEGAMGCLHEIDPVGTIVNQSKGQYAIHLACQYSLQRLIQQILHQPAAGNVLTQLDAMGNTPLHYASMSTVAAPQSLDVVKLLIKSYGASVILKNNQGQTPYDIATLNSIRQYLLPIQLQAETQIAIDNGGRGLPPGMDMGGLRIQNSALPPPPTFGGGPLGMAAVGAGTGMAPPPATATAAATAAAADGPPGTPSAIPAASHTTATTANMFGTPSPSQLHHRIASAPVSAAPPATPAAPGGGYSRVGSSSAALSTASKYRADGFHSSSSDVSLQKKYGNVQGSVSGYGRPAIAPPPSSGNSVGSAAASVGGVTAAPMSGGANPFAAGNRVAAGGGAAAAGRYGALSNRRYPTYGQVAAAPVSASSSGPAYNHASMYSPAAGAGGAGVGVGAVNMFTPGGGTAQPVTSPSPYGMQQQQQQQPHPSHASMPYVGGVPIVDPSPAITPTTAYMPPPPYQSHNYHPSGGGAAAAYARPDMVSPAGVTYAGSSMTPAAATLSTQNPANIADAQASDIFSAPSPQKEATATAAPEPIPEESTETPVTTTDSNNNNNNINWVETVDPTSGQTYYYNAVTGETSWEKPVSEAVVASGTDALPEYWVEVTDPSSGRPYYYNTVTQETAWDKPVATETMTATDPSTSNAATTSITTTEADSAATTTVEPVVAPVVTDAFATLTPAMASSGAFTAPSPLRTSEAFAAPALAAVEPISAPVVVEAPTTDVSAAPAPFAATNEAEAAADSFLAPMHEPTPQSLDGVLAAATPQTTLISSDAWTAGGSSPFDIGLVRGRTLSADDLFATDAPGETSEGESDDLDETTTDTPSQPHVESTPVVARTDPSPVSATETDHMGTDSIAEPVLAESQPPASTLPSPAEVEPTPPNQGGGEAESDDMMDDIPLSPTPQRRAPNTTTAMSAAATTPAGPGPGPSSEAADKADTDSLFAVIGMPPPPFTAKKR